MFRDNVQLPYYMKYLLKTSEKKKMFRDLLYYERSF